MGMAVRAIGLLSLTVLLACATAESPASGSDRTDAIGLQDPALLQTCEDAFRVWVQGSRALNDPGVDMLEHVVGLENIQRRVFELCTLAEAERLNREILLEIAPGAREPLIQPDFRTFAEVECVDESPLLDGTPLCDEVSR